jgi:hypothetical protein
MDEQRSAAISTFADTSHPTGGSVRETNHILSPSATGKDD